MQTLRNAHFIARLVLVWFALSIGVAIASPMVKPQSLQLICSGTGAIKIISSDADGKAATTPSSTSTHTLDCPLCAAMAAPPPVDANHLAFAAPLGYTSPARAAASPVPFFATPPPARGPPDSL